MNNNKIRNGLRTLWWNPKLVDGAVFDDFDIPFCPTIASGFPENIITYEEAKTIYHREIKQDPDFINASHVCFFLDDYKFDTFRGVWFSPHTAMKILKHFKGIITPDFSTYQDFPFPLKIWNTYRSRAFGYWAGKHNIEVINGVRGSIEDTAYCFRGVGVKSTIAIGTVGSGLKTKDNYNGFSVWFSEMLKTLKPIRIIVYGSSNYPCFEQARKTGIQIMTYESSTSKAYKRRTKDE